MQKDWKLRVRLRLNIVTSWYTHVIRVWLFHQHSSLQTSLTRVLTKLVVGSSHSMQLQQWCLTPLPLRTWFQQVLCSMQRVTRWVSTWVTLPTHLRWWISMVPTLYVSIWWRTANHGITWSSTQKVLMSVVVSSSVPYIIHTASLLSMQMLTAMMPQHVRQWRLMHQRLTVGLSLNLTHSSRVWLLS